MVVGFEDFRATVFFMVFLALVFVAVGFFAVGFLALPALATFLRGAGLEGDFRATVFFMVFLALATFLRGAVVPTGALADTPGDVPLA